MSTETIFIQPKFKDTLGSDEWLETNKERLLELFPETYTHLQNLNPLALGYTLKLLGLDWKTDMEFGFIMMFLVKKGFGEHDAKNKFLVRRNSNFKLNKNDNVDEVTIKA